MGRYMRSTRPCFPGWHLSKPSGTPTLLVRARCNHELSVSELWFARRCALVRSGPALVVAQDGETLGWRRALQTYISQAQTPSARLKILPVQDQAYHSSVFLQPSPATPIHDPRQVPISTGIGPRTCARTPATVEAALRPQGW